MADLCPVVSRRLRQPHDTDKGCDHAHASHEAQTPGSERQAGDLPTGAEEALHPRSREFSEARSLKKHNADEAAFKIKRTRSVPTSESRGNFNNVASRLTQSQTVQMLLTQVNKL